MLLLCEAESKDYSGLRRELLPLWQGFCKLALRQGETGQALRLIKPTQFGLTLRLLALAAYTRLVTNWRMQCSLAAHEALYYPGG